MTKLTMAVTLKKLRIDIDTCRYNYQITGQEKYKIAFNKLVSNYNEIIDLIN